jgi:starch synthase
LPRPLTVLFIAAEADPFVKVGGLGDVAGALPRALRALAPDLDVRLALPRHPELNLKGFELRHLADYGVQRGNGWVMARAHETRLDGLPVYLIEGAPISTAPAVYATDMSVDGEKYAFFSLAALELARQLRWSPRILHANDWHTAAAVYALSLRRGESEFSWIRSVMCVHNLPFMGGGAGPSLSAYGLHQAPSAGLPDWARHFPLPMGLATADAIVAVSPAYAHEMLTPEYGCGLQDFLRTRAGAILGILNGIDTRDYDPGSDPALTANYDADSLRARGANKMALRASLGLPADPGLPLLGLVSRMDPQKGVDIAMAGLRLAAHLPWQAVLLGTGIEYLEQEAAALQRDFPERVRSIVRYDAALSRQIYAGADLLLMPSRYEPCGLAQMIAMRYGCVPLVRETGGLGDTVSPYTDLSKGTGFLFLEASPQAFADTLAEALALYESKDRWLALQRNGMAQDFSWERSARAYEALYRRLAI